MTNDTGPEHIEAFDELTRRIGVDRVPDEENPLMHDAVSAYEAWMRKCGADGVKAADEQAARLYDPRRP